MATQDSKYHELENADLLENSRKNLARPPSDSFSCDVRKNWKPIGFTLLFLTVVAIGIAIGLQFRSNDDNGPSYINGYTLSHVSSSATGYEFWLNITDGAAQYGADISPLKVTVTFDTIDRVRVKIFDPFNARFEVPQLVLPDPPAAPNQPTFGELLYTVSWTVFPFGFAVTRRADSVVMFNSTANGAFNGLIFQNQYLEISTQIPNAPLIYGLGEHINDLLIPSDGPELTMWARDTPSPFNENIYGSHPFYLELRNGRTHGVFLKNANGMDVSVRPGRLTYKIIGGIFDFYVFVGPTPEVTIQQYHAVIGTPFMPPFWSLGFHQCRWGYTSLSVVSSVVANYNSHQIPLDAMWTDIDYMDNYLDFTFDPVNFPVNQMVDFVGSLHDMGKRYVVIVDPGIHPQPGYAVYDQGKAANAFIKDRTGSQDFVGVVWPGTAVYPDFLDQSVHMWWQMQIENFTATVPVDGLWIDMNEASNFCNSNQNPTTCPTVTPAPHVQGFDPNYPPYTIRNCGDAMCALNTKTIDPDAVHNDGTLEYNAHNLYGTSEAIATSHALQAITNKRSFVMGRSTFAGSGAHEAHWLGDNWSQWPYLAVSIPGILAMNMYGIPLVGADICGFIGTTTEELCSRWMELGAFYPFSRNHNDIKGAPQEPYLWPSVAAISRKVLGARYSLLAYMNTLFYNAHTVGGTVARPLFFEFPLDPLTVTIDSQFMLGSYVLVSPCLTQGATSVGAYLPGSSAWYDFWTWAPVNVLGLVTLSAPIDFIPVHIRGGAILPLQNSTGVMSTVGLADADFNLVVALDPAGGAQGDLFMDDGLNLAMTNYFLAHYTCSGQLFEAAIDSIAYLPAANKWISSVNFLGVKTAPTSVQVSGMGQNPWTYSSATQVLSVSVDINLVTAFSIQWT